MTALRNILIAGMISMAMTACSDIVVHPAEKKNEQDTQATVVKMEEALFCFKCHSRANYDGRGGKFPHIAHQGMLRDMVGGVLHCNQCHDIKGHAKLKTISKANAPCSNCH